MSADTSHSITSLETMSVSVSQIFGYLMIIKGKFSLILHKNICCRYTH